MKKIKIFALPSHAEKHRVHGVDMVRVIQPMEHLNGYSDGEVEFEVTIYDPRKEELHNEDQAEWTKVAKENDIIFFNYLNNPWGFAAMGAMARAHGTKLVMDLDDSLWNIKPDNPAYKVYHSGSQPIMDFTSIANEVDYITCTSDYLKHVIQNNTRKSADKIQVIPNYIDLKLYNHKPPFKNDGRINLVHFGSTTHFADLNEPEFNKGIERIMKEYPQVNLIMIGAHIPRLKNRWSSRYTVLFGHEDVYSWIEGRFKEYMDMTDIMVVPLTNDIYNRCKSGIKYLEASSAGKPGVYQNLRQYSDLIQDGVNGFLATKDTDWYNKIKTLIDNPELRRNMGDYAYQTVEQEYQIQDNIKDYAEFFKSLL